MAQFHQQIKIHDKFKRISRDFRVRITFDILKKHPVHHTEYGI